MMSELILFVDGEPSIAALIHLHLEREGSWIASAGDGAEALTVALVLPYMGCK